MVLEHEQWVDYCRFWMNFWYYGDNRFSTIWEPRQDDNGQGMGMGIRMYLGPGQNPGTPTPEPNPGTIPGPPIVGEPEIPDEPDPEEPPPVTCSNNVMGTCPGNGPWNYNIWEFSNAGDYSWPTYMKERFKAGAYVVGKLFNDGRFEDCINNYSASDFQNTTYSSTGLGTKPNGQQVFDFLYAGREPSWNSTSGGTDQQADVRYFYYGNKPCGTLASAGVPGSSITFGKCYYETSVRSPSATGSNMTHEWSHNMGFGHTCACSDSYPYRIGSCISAQTLYNTEARTRFPGGNW